MTNIRYADMILRAVLCEQTAVLWKVITLVLLDAIKDWGPQRIFGFFSSFFTKQARIYKFMWAISTEDQEIHCMILAAKSNVFKIMNSWAWWSEGCRAMWQKLYIRPPGGTDRDRHMNSLTKLTTAIYNLIIVCILWIIIVDRYRCS